MTRTRTGTIGSGLASFLLGFAACGVLAAAIAAGPRDTPRTLPDSTSTTTFLASPAPELADERAVFLPPPPFEPPTSHIARFDSAWSIRGWGTSRCAVVPWETFNPVEIPAKVLLAAKESIDGLDIHEAYIARLGPLTLFTLGGYASGHEVALVLTEQGTILQADAATSGDAIPDELAGVLNDRFPGASIAKAGISQLVSFWAELTTQDGQRITVTFEPDQGLSVVDAPLFDESSIFETFTPVRPAHTDANPGYFGGSGE